MIFNKISLSPPNVPRIQDRRKESSLVSILMYLKDLGENLAHSRYRINTH